MKLGEIKIEALRLMFANNDDDLTIDNNANAGSSGSAVMDLNHAKSDPQYRDYLNNMNGAINRCFTILEARHVLPVKRVELTPDEDQTFDLSTISDLDDIQRVTIRRSYGGYDAAADYELEWDKMLLSLLDGDEVALIYYPRLTRVTVATDDSAELSGVPDKIAALIPYYVKYDLFREDDANEANAALRRFEESLSMITEREETHQSGVDSVLFTNWMEG